MRVILDSRRRRLREIEEELARLRSLPTGVVYKHLLVRELDGSELSTQESTSTISDGDGEILNRTISGR